MNREYTLRVMKVEMLVHRHLKFMEGEHGLGMC